MCDFLIYNKQHWTKTVALSVTSKWTAHEQDKFAAVHEIGDIVEVQPDGFYDRGFNKDAFRVVKKPAFSFDRYKVLMDSVDYQFAAINGKTYMQYRRRGKVDGSDNIIDKLGKL